MIARIYARYSTDRQSETSVVDQFRVGGLYATPRTWPTKQYDDAGISGAALGNRPGLLQLLRDIQPGDVLLVTDTFRLARSQDLAPLITRLRFRGVRVIGIQDHFDSDAPHAGMQAGLSGIMSEQYRENIRVRTHSALEMRARLGQPTGGKAYEEPQIVLEIFQRFAAGESMKGIASDLNRRGIPSPGASWKRRSSPRGCWMVSALHAILHNERYIGRQVWNRSQWVKDPDTGKRIRRERPESEWVVQPCERLIDDETWARVQAKFSGRPGGKGGAPRWILSGLLECALCGSKLIVVGGTQRRYVCSANHAGGDHACGNRSSVARTIAERYILEPVLTELLSPEAIAEGVRQLRAARMAAEHAPVPVNREVMELERMVREGLLSPDTAAPALRQARAKFEAQPEPMPWPSEKAWRETVLNLRDVLKGEDIPAARAALKGIIGPVRCTPAEGGVVAELTARRVLMGTGSGIWVGSGDALRIYIPYSTRNLKPSGSAVGNAG